MIVRRVSRSPSPSGSTRTRPGEEFEAVGVVEDSTGEGPYDPAGPEVPVSPLSWAGVDSRRHRSGPRSVGVFFWGFYGTLFTF